MDLDTPIYIVSTLPAFITLQQVKLNENGQFEQYMTVQAPGDLTREFTVSRRRKDGRGFI